MLKLIDEKRLLSEVSSLRKQRKILESFGPQESSIEADKKKLDELRTKLRTFDPEKDRFKKEMDSLFTQLKALDADRDEGTLLHTFSRFCLVHWLAFFFYFFYFRHGKRYLLP
jgi:hypothetical protein